MIKYTLGSLGVIAYSKWLWERQSSNNNEITYDKSTRGRMREVVEAMPSLKTFNHTPYIVGPIPQTLASDIFLSRELSKDIELEREVRLPS